MKNNIQKSFIFLYPLLQIQSKRSIKPLKTYMYCSGMEDELLICIYKVNRKHWSSFNEKVLSKHKLLKSTVPLTDKKYAYIFDLSEFKKDYDLISVGKYHLLSQFAKTCIMSFDHANFDEVKLCIFDKQGTPPDREKETYNLSKESVEYGEFLINR